MSNSNIRNTNLKIRKIPETGKNLEKLSKSGIFPENPEDLATPVGIFISDTYISGVRRNFSRGGPTS
jgi:hypothetical protein